jgi:nicotinamidase-related amidase
MKTARNKNHRRSANSPKAPVALLLIDVINDLEFAAAEALLKRALPMARRLADLKRRASQKEIPCIYVNDNFGQWKSDFRHIVRHCNRSRGGQIARLLAPSKADYFVLKPKHSGFYATTLDLLLEYLGTRILIITGIAADICVLFTANDAYMRDYQLHVPADCVASNTSWQEEYSLGQMRNVLKAQIQDSSAIDLDAMLTHSVDARKSTAPKKLLAPSNGTGRWP